MLEHYTIKLDPSESARVTVNPSKSDGVSIGGYGGINAEWNPWNEKEREFAKTASSIQVVYDDDLVKNANLGDIITLKVIACHHNRSLLGHTTVSRTKVLTFKAKVLRKGCDVVHQLGYNNSAVVEEHYHYISVGKIEGIEE